MMLINQKSQAGLNERLVREVVNEYYYVHKDNFKKINLNKKLKKVIDQIL